MMTSSLMHPIRNPLLRGITVVVIAGGALSGCAGFFNGYDAENQFKCKAPPGVQCQSISGVYANSQGGTSASNQAVPQEGRRATDSTSGALPLPAARNMGAGLPPTYSGAIRSEPTTIRTWVMSYKDADGDIVDQFYVYMALDSGHWMIEHAQQLVRDSYAPSRPVRAMGTGLPTAGSGSSANRPTSALPSDAADKVQDTAAGSTPAEQNNTQDPASMIQRIQEAMRRASQPGSNPPAGADETSPKPTR